MAASIDDTVRSAVDAWLRWLPRWHPGTLRTRTRMCSTCFGSEFSALFRDVPDVPHQVQHALVMRLKRIVEDEVDDYIRHNLPMLEAELKLQEDRKAKRPYRPEHGLAPEYQGLDLDPEAEPGEPFLFTMADLAEQAAAETGPVEPLPPLTREAKDALKHEIQLSDEVATVTGLKVRHAFEQEKDRVVRAIEEFVEPQVQAVLDELAKELDAPPLR